MEPWTIIVAIVAVLTVIGVVAVRARS